MPSGFKPEDRYAGGREFHFVGLAERDIEQVTEEHADGAHVADEGDGVSGMARSQPVQAGHGSIEQLAEGFASGWAPAPVVGRPLVPHGWTQSDDPFGRQALELAREPFAKGGIGDGSQAAGSSDRLGRLHGATAVGAMDGHDRLVDQPSRQRFGLPEADLGQLTIVPAMPRVDEVTGGLAVTDEDEAHAQRLKEFRVQSSEFRVQSSEFGVQSSEFRVQSSEFRVRSSEFGVQSSEFRVQSSEFRVQSSEFRVQSSDS